MLTRQGAAGAVFYAIRPVVVAVAVVALAVAPAVVATRWLSPLLTRYDAHSPAAYVATTAVLWGAISLALVALGSRLWHREAGSRSTALDLTFGGAALATLGAWVLSIYEWNIAKFGGVEIDAVGPTTFLWPFLVIFAVTLVPFVRARRATPVAVAALLALLVIDLVLAVVGALRDGSISPLGLTVGVFYLLELGILATWIGIKARLSRA